MSGKENEIISTGANAEKTYNIVRNSVITAQSQWCRRIGR